jgi:hypothetical protein
MSLFDIFIAQHVWAYLAIIRCVRSLHTAQEEHAQHHKNIPVYTRKWNYAFNS